MARLTEAYAKKLKSRSARYDVKDDEVSKLRLRVYPSGRKTWTLLYWSDGKQCRETLGAFLEPDGKTVIVSPSEARLDARAFLARLGKQGGVAREKAVLASMPTLDEWFEKFIGLNPRDWAEKTVIDYKSRYKHYVRPVFGRLRLHKIAEPDLEEFSLRVRDGKKLAKVEGKRPKGGAKTADKSIELILTLLKWADKPHDILPGSWRLPSVERKYRGIEKEENYIYSTEAAAFYMAVDRLRNRSGAGYSENKSAADIILLALYTGGRKSNVLAMEWSEIDLAGYIWRIPRAKYKTRKKTNRGHNIPLIPQAVEILISRRLLQESKGVSPKYVFPSAKYPEKHFDNIDKSWRYVRKEANLERVNFHGLRHTLATWQGQSGVNQKMISASLGHADPTSANRYVHSDIEVVRGNMAGVIDASYTIIQEGPDCPEVINVGLNEGDWAEVVAALDGNPWAAKLSKLAGVSGLKER